MNGKGREKVTPLRNGRPNLPAVILWFLAVILAGCDPAPSTLLLPGTGERITPAIASISGTVTIPGAPTPYPAIRVYALKDADTTCVSTFTAIQVLGNYTDPEFSVANTPAMVRLVGCVWVDSLFLDPPAFLRTPGRMQWKFVTNRSFDNPPDYGQPGGQVDGFEAAVVLGAGGDDGNLLADVTAAGPYLALLDEERLRYSILPFDIAPVGDVDRQTGAFTVDKLRDGLYTLILRGDGVVTRRITRVAITGGAAVDIGAVTIRSATTAITGSVGFEGAPALATVTLQPNGSSEILGTVQTMDEFSFTGIDLGSYDVRFRAPNYRDSTVTVVYSGDLVDLGTITLRQGCSSEFDRIQVAGDLNPALYGNFDLTRAPDMTEIDGCVWQATLNGVTAGNHFFKFVTNGAFDTPADYGSDEVCRTELTGTVMPVTGAGTAICVTFAETGNYRFTLNEDELTYSIEQIIVQQPGTLRGTVSFAGSPPAGLKAFVRVIEGGTSNTVASDSTLSAWEFGGLAPGNYDVRFSATGYTDSTRSAIVVANQTTDLGNTQLRAGFASQFNRIQVAGNLNEALYGNFDLLRAPDMTQTSPGIWKATLTGITGGNKLWKFVTNGNFDSPPDYGSDEVCRTDLTGTVSLVTGIGTAICVTFPSGTADYEFTLNEQTLTFTIVRQGTVGQGSVNGSVTFGATSGPPFPVATIRLQTQAGTTDIGTTTSNATTGAFSFTMLEAGTYKVIAQASCYVAVTTENIAVATSAVNLPAVTLAAGTSAFNFIQLAGSFNGFDLNTAPRMTQIASCVWADTLMFTSPGAIEFKFITDGDFDSPTPDYGVPGTQTDPLAGPAVLGAPGDGGNIKVEIPAPGNWRFELDERLKTYTISATATASTRRPGK